MPNAATFDDDLAYGRETTEGTGRGPRGAPRKPRASAPSNRKKKKSRWPRIDMHRVARLAAVGMASTMAIGIMVNALMLQKGHHPAPLFAQKLVSAEKPTVATPAAPAPEVRADVGVGNQPAVAAAKTKKANGTRLADIEAPASSDDAIARLIAGGGAGAKVDAADSHTVTNVQRTLTKLGFKVPATGVAGPATRKAIEAYEKDRHLPVRGEVDRRLVKALSADAKTKVD